MFLPWCFEDVIALGATVNACAGELGYSMVFKRVKGVFMIFGSSWVPTNSVQLGRFDFSGAGQWVTVAELLQNACQLGQLRLVPTKPCSTLCIQHVSSTTPKKLWCSLEGWQFLQTSRRTLAEWSTNATRCVKMLSAERLNCALRSAEASTELSNWRTLVKMWDGYGWLVWKTCVLDKKTWPGQHWICSTFRGWLIFFTERKVWFLN